MLAVLGTLNIGSVAIMASAESGYQALLAASSAPERVSSLVLFHCSPVWVAKEDLPWEASEERARATVESIRRSTSWDEWARQFVREALPSHADDDQAIAWFATMQRLTEGPGRRSPTWIQRRGTTCASDWRGSRRGR